MRPTGSTRLLAQNGELNIQAPPILPNHSQQGFGIRVGPSGTVASIATKVLSTLTYSQLLQSTDTTEPCLSSQISRLITSRVGVGSFCAEWDFEHTRVKN